MDALQARVNSFKKSKRVKNPSKPSSTTTLKWPHPPQFKANPESLAEAGFYYDPSYDDPDNVTCYVCEKELGGWEEEDDPFLIHWAKCGQICCWANVRCGLMSDLDSNGRYISTDKTRIPTHKSMEKARHETFFTGKGWDHDKVANHGANSKMMARAGFVFTPQHNGDDLATCFYCNTSLSGWDAEDDPMEEHRKREKKMGFSCPFFSALPTDIASNTKAVSRVQSTKPSSKSQAKPPSRSTSRSKHHDILQPTKTDDGELDEESDTPPKSGAQSTTKTSHKGRATTTSTKKSSAKTPRSKTRSTSRTGLKNVAEEDDEEEEVLHDVQPPPEKKGRSRSKSVAKAKVVNPPETDDTEQETAKPSRSRSKKVVSDVDEEVPRKSSRSKSKATTTVDDEVPRKPSRAKSKSKAVDSEHDDAPHITAKPKHTRTASKSKSKAPVETSDLESEHEVEPEILTVAPKKKTSVKSKTPAAPAAQDLFDDDVFTDHYVPPPASNLPNSSTNETTELPPLVIPKRNPIKKAPTPEEATEVVPIEKEKKKPGRPKNKPPAPSPNPQPLQSDDEGLETEPLSVGETHQPLAPVSTNPSTSSSSKDKFSGKMKPSNHKMKVVEISSDEEPAEKEAQHVPQQDKENSRSIPKSQLLSAPVLQTQPPSLPPMKQPAPQVKREKKKVLVETVQPVPTPTPTPIPTFPRNDDVSMASVEPEETTLQNAPVTPTKPTAQTPPPEEHEHHHPLSPETEPVSADPPYIPALSKLPFTPLHALSEPELDMTVEEWIRYQMDVEFDKFRRDGERELQRFRKRAEEVRKVIEGL